VLILHRALLREALTTILAVTLVFVSLFAIITFVQVLRKAANGEIATAIVFPMLGLQSVKMLGHMLPLAFFIGLLMTLNRWYRDSEMAVLAACGVGYRKLLVPVMMLSLGMAAAVAVVAFFVTPAANALIVKLKADESQRFEGGNLPSGVFSDIRRSGGVYYVERTESNGQLVNVFANHAHLGRQGVLNARRGHFENAPNGDDRDRLLVLEEGTRYDGVAGQPDYRVIDFARYTLWVEWQSGPVVQRFEAMKNRELLAPPPDKLRGEARALHQRATAAEWHWRIATPLTVIPLALFAMVFAYASPRSGRYGSFLLAVLVYFLYSNSLGIGEALMRRGRLAPEMGYWWAHLVFLALAVWWFRQRDRQRPLFSWPAWRRAP
jgi:lipopolysaccharide export system permease protein